MDANLFSLNHQLLNQIIEAEVERLVSEHLETFQKELSDNYIFNDRLLSREEVAIKLDVSLGKLDTMRKRKTIKGYSVGNAVKFKNSEILDYIKSLK